MGDSRERRRFTRVRSDLTAELAQPGHPLIACKLEDLSMSGVLLSVHGDVADGQTSTVRLVLAGAEPPIRITAKGDVSRLDGDRVAVAFAEIDEESYAHLRKLVLVNADDPARVEDELDTSIGIKRQPTDF